MLDKIRYHDYNDSLWFTSDVLGGCDIDKDGELSFMHEFGFGYEKCNHTFYIPIEELRRIISLYDARKSIKDEA